MNSEKAFAGVLLAVFFYLVLFCHPFLYEYSLQDVEILQAHET